MTREYYIVNQFKTIYHDFRIEELNLPETETAPW